MAKIAIQISSLATPIAIGTTGFETYADFRIQDGQDAYTIKVTFTFDVTDSAQQINNKMVANVRAQAASLTPIVLNANDPVVFSAVSLS